MLSPLFSEQSGSNQKSKCPFEARVPHSDPVLALSLASSLSPKFCCKRISDCLLGEDGIAPGYLFVTKMLVNGTVRYELHRCLLLWKQR